MVSNPGGFYVLKQLLLQKPPPSHPESHWNKGAYMTCITLCVAEFMENCGFDIETLQFDTEPWDQYISANTFRDMSCICICWSNPCDAICITGFRIFLHQGAMRGRLGEGRLIWGGRACPNTWSFNKGDQESKTKQTSAQKTMYCKLKTLNRDIYV